MALVLKNLVFTVVIPGTIGVYLPLSIARGLDPRVGLARGVAIVLFGIGAAIYGWCLYDFATFGRGTPFVLDAPKRLVVRGLYRYVRNPMYLGVLTCIAGWAPLYGSWAIAAYLAAVALGFHLMVVGYEEPHLRRLFGSDYERYSRTVRRWLPGRRYGEA